MTLHQSPTRAAEGAPGFNATARDRQFTAAERQPAKTSPTQPERVSHSCARGAPDFNATNEHRQFRAVRTEVCR
jgi:hypothetical protein